MEKLDHISILLEKHLKGTASPAEQAELTGLMEQYSNEELGELLLPMAAQTQPDSRFAENDWEMVIRDILRREPEKTAKPARVIHLRAWKKYAAAAVILVTGLGTGGYLLWNGSASRPVAVVQQNRAAKNDVPPGGNKAVLTLADGRHIILDNAANGSLARQGGTRIIKLDSGRLAYRPATGTEEPVLYNTVATPRGGQYQLVLPDGSKVWLDAASSLRFPSAFTGKERRVSLTGQGYFEVAKNESKPFVVEAGKLAVQVLGTDFNIMAYDEEGAVRTSLVDGKVKVTGAGNGVLLNPGDRADWNRTGGDLTIKQADLPRELAWKEGYFLFDDDDIGTIMRMLARWYDVEVEYSGKVPGESYSGKVSRKVGISQVLHMLELAGGVHFTIEGKKVTVLPGKSPGPEGGI